MSGCHVFSGKGASDSFPEFARRRPRQVNSTEDFEESLNILLLSGAKAIRKNPPIRPYPNVVYKTLANGWNSNKTTSHE